MKKIISIIVVIVTVLLVGFCPSFVNRKISGDTLQAKDGAVTTGEVSLAKAGRSDETADDGDISEPETTEYGSFFGSYQDPATFDDDLIIVKKNAETEPEEVYYPTVLMYHCVHDEPYTQNTALFVRPSELESHLQALCERNIDCLFADEFGPVSKSSVVLTFDDGYEDNYTYMFPLIKKYNIKVTVYMIAYKIDTPGYLSSEQIREMSDSGLVQFGSHTLDHPSLTGLSEEGVRQQFEGSSWLISEVTGKPVTTVAYPSGDYNETVMNVAREFYSFAFTTDDDHYFGQDNMMLPRYAILRGTTKAGFLTFVD